MSVTMNDGGGGGGEKTGDERRRWRRRRYGETGGGGGEAAAAIGRIGGGRRQAFGAIVPPSEKKDEGKRKAKHETTARLEPKAYPCLRTKDLPCRDSGEWQCSLGALLRVGGPKVARRCPVGRPSSGVRTAARDVSSLAAAVEF